MPFATVNANNLGFKIQSSSLDYSGTYNIWAVIVPAGAHTVQPVKIPYQIKFTTCSLHDFSTIYPDSDINYEIGSGNYYVNPDLSWWTPTSCVLTFAAQVDGNSEIDPTEFSFDPSTGVLTINNSKPETNNYMHYVELTVSDTSGN